MSNCQELRLVDQCLLKRTFPHDSCLGYRYLFQLVNNCLVHCWIHLRIWGLGAAISLSPIVKNAQIPTRRHKMGQDFLKCETLWNVCQQPWDHCDMARALG